MLLSDAENVNLNLELVPPVETNVEEPKEEKVHHENGKFLKPP
jgi:hypothetical protein